MNTINIHDINFNEKILSIFERYDNNNNIGNVQVAYESGDLEIMHTSPNCTWTNFKNKDFFEKHAHYQPSLAWTI
jgi:hypothetical protein